MGAVSSNLLVRVKADFSNLFGAFQSANAKTKSEMQGLARAATSTGKVAEQLRQTQREIQNTERYLSGLSNKLEELAGSGVGRKSDMFDLLGKEADKTAAKLDQLKGQEVLLQIQQEANGAADGVRRLGNESAKTGEKSRGSFLETAKSILHIGRNSRSSLGGIEKMLSSLRRIGGVAIGLRLVSAVTGRLRSIVHEYISENAALKAQVDALRSSLGNALAPAINIVANAFSAAMPYIIGFSNAIGNLLGKLFGNGWTTVASGANSASKAIGGASAAQKEFNRQLASFDEITKLDSNKGGGGGGGGGAGSAITTDILGKPSWLTDIVGSISNAIDGTGTWLDVGHTIGGKIRDAVAAIDWDKVWNTADSLFDGGMDVLRGTLSSAIDAPSDQWTDIGFSFGTKTLDAIANMPWDTLGKDAGYLFGSFLAFIGGALGGAFASDSENLKAALGEGFIGLLDGIFDGFGVDFETFGLNLAAIGESITSELERAKNTVKDWLGINKLQTWLEENGWNEVTVMVKADIQAIKDEFWAPVKEWWNDFRDNNPLLVKLGLAPDWEKIQEVINSIREKVGGSLGALWSNSTVGRAYNDFRSGWDWISSSWSSYFGKHADGGIFTGPTVFGNQIFGEAGKEALLPLENNLGYLDDFAGKIASRIGGGQPVQINLILDGKVVGKASVDYINNQAASTGLNPIAAYL